MESEEAPPKYYPVRVFDNISTKSALLDSEIPPNRAAKRLRNQLGCDEAADQQFEFDLKRYIKVLECDTKLPPRHSYVTLDFNAPLLHGLHYIDRVSWDVGLPDPAIDLYVMRVSKDLDLDWRQCHIISKTMLSKVKDIREKLANGEVIASREAARLDQPQFRKTPALITREDIINKLQNVRETKYYQNKKEEKKVEEGGEGEEKEGSPAAAVVKEEEKEGQRLMNRAAAVDVCAFEIIA